MTAHPEHTPTTPAAPAPLAHPATRFNHEQAEQLATYIHALRPTWDLRGIIVALDKVANDPNPPDSFTVSLAMLHAARNPNNKTPEIINYPGPHRDYATHTNPTKPPTPEKQRTLGTDTSPMCPKHTQLHTWECKTCRKKTPKPANFNQLVQQAAQAHKATQHSNEA